MLLFVFCSSPLEDVIGVVSPLPVSSRVLRRRWFLPILIVAANEFWLLNKTDDPFFCTE